MTYPAGIDISVQVGPEQSGILTPEALAFVAELARKFEPVRVSLLQSRVQRQAELDAGKLPDFLAATAAVRNGDWTIDPVPAELQDRRVELTGPAERKMLINGLNAGAQVYMADMEDSMTPTWPNVMDAQINLRDAVNRTISHVSQSGKHYRLNKEVAVMFMRPRGWHMVEKHLTVDGKPVSASLFDFGLYYFHNAKTLLRAVFLPAQDGKPSRGQVVERCLHPCPGTSRHRARNGQGDRAGRDHTGRFRDG
jgi:malate synthase